MTERLRSRLALAALCVAVCGCQGQQYVDPATVALVITNDSTSVQRVNRCNYVPILLGSEVKTRYVIEGDLKATITITRDDLSVTFEGGADDVEPFTVPVTRLIDDKTETAENPPAGYTVELDTGCTPEEI